jgi:hypothetical protein
VFDCQLSKFTESNLTDMRIVLENVDSQYMGVINELAQVLRFKVTNVETETKKAEIDRRIEMCKNLEQC